MKKKHALYTIEELLKDDYFISSVLHPTPDSNEFWDFLLQNGQVSLDDFEQASLFIRKVQPCRKKLTSTEKMNLWKSIEIEKKKILKKKIHKLFTVTVSTAASIVLLLSASAYFWLNNESNRSNNLLHQIKSVSKPDISTSEIQLILSGQKQIVLDEVNVEVMYNSKGEVKVNTRTIIEESKAEKPKEELSPVYNQLIVPRGKHSTLLLSDGSKLWLNAGTHVIFPVAFNVREREIYVDGEVYLEVAPCKDWPFVVKTSRMSVSVLGTSFNINAYEEETDDTVVLVTGAVSITTVDNKEALLSPNQLLSCSSSGIKIQTVDVRNYISWKDGLMQYQSERVSFILQRLSKYYGKEIKWDLAVSSLRCTGKLDLKEDLEKVLSGLTKTLPVYYKKQNDSYYISINH